MLSGAKAVADAYLESWNETDEVRRRSLFGRAWAERSSYVDPLMKGDGPEQISALVGAVHPRFPGFCFALSGMPDGYGDYVRLSWSLGPAGTPAPIEGSDVIRIEGGRIASVIGFIN